MRNMFDDIVDPSVKMGSKMWYTVPFTMLLQACAVAAIIVVPLMAAGVMPTPYSEMSTYMMVETPPTPPMPVVRANELPKTMTAPSPPTTAPTGFKKETGFENFENKTVIDLFKDVVKGDGDKVIFEPPPAARKIEVPQAPQRVGGQVKPPQKTRDVRPLYPPIAQSARVQGMVIIEATIGADGAVVDAKVLKGVPLLNDAALDAVRQWVFTPTLLNGVPMPVIMTVTVQFTLQ